MSDFDLTPFDIEIGADMPEWFETALDLGRVVPLPEPKIGDLDWGREGVLVVKTGCIFPIGSRMMKGDLLFPPI